MKLAKNICEPLINNVTCCLRAVINAEGDATKHALACKKPSNLNCAQCMNIIVIF